MVVSFPRPVVSSQPQTVVQPPALPPVPAALPPAPPVIMLPLPAHPVRVPRQAVRKPRAAKIWPSSSRSSSRLAEQRRTLLSAEQRSVSLSPARPPDLAGQIADENLGAEPAAESTTLVPAEQSEVVQEYQLINKLPVSCCFVLCDGQFLLVPLCRICPSFFSFCRVVKGKDVVYLLAPLAAY